MDSELLDYIALGLPLFLFSVIQNWEKEVVITPVSLAQKTQSTVENQIIYVLRHQGFDLISAILESCQFEIKCISLAANSVEVSLDELVQARVYTFFNLLKILDLL